jgi:hypothetical protein
MKLNCLLFLLLFLPWRGFADVNAPVCPPPEIALTKPTPVNVEAILDSLAKIKTDKGELAFKIDEPLKKAIHDSFGSGRVKTKMEQFYSTLFFIQEFSSLPAGVMHNVPGGELHDTLMFTGVFPDPTVPDKISMMSFRRSSLTPLYEVSFKEPTVSLPLNHGNGFSTLQHGKCQHAKALIFRSPFRFYLKLQPNGNLMVYKFQNVDIEGEFGTHGVLDIDLNYVTLVSVEFIRNTPLGYVQARVADKEFEVNNHGWFLKMVTSFFSGTTKQAIDW